MTKTRSIGHLLNNANAGLANVIQRSKELQKLSTYLKNAVDAPLSEHIYVANIRDVTLVIGADSAVWHTRIKYLGPMILEQLKQVPGLENLQQIEFRIQPLGYAMPASRRSINHFPSASPSHPIQKAKSSNTGTLKNVIQRISKKTV
ncbi:MAG: DUF721 domain-containing protein [Gammaproteobacteria bacterium]|nr:DUF721 domain-containing protein [Gammaproteobacteria bacterium]